MKGLMLKDFLQLQKMWKNYLFIIVMFLIMGGTTRKPTFLFSALSIIAYMAPITTFSLDETYNWNKFALTTPITKEKFVLSKYIFALIIGAIVWVISLIAGLITPTIEITTVIYSLCATSLLGMLYISTFFPIFLKFGITKARLLMFIFVFVPIFAGSLVVSHAGDSTSSSLESIDSLLHLLYFAPLVGLIIMVISYFVSVSIMKNKEFS